MNLQLQDHKPLLENQPALPAQVADSMQDILASLQVTPGDSKESVLEAGQPFHCYCLSGRSLRLPGPSTSQDGSQANARREGGGEFEKKSKTAAKSAAKSKAAKTAAANTGKGP